MGQQKSDLIDRAVEEGQFRADWNSLCRWRLPAWFRNAKFGIFIHWGLYSILAHANEWYSRNKRSGRKCRAIFLHIQPQGGTLVFYGAWQGV